MYSLVNVSYEEVKIHLLLDVQIPKKNYFWKESNSTNFLSWSLEPNLSTMFLETIGFKK